MERSLSFPPFQSLIPSLTVGFQASSEYSREKVLVFGFFLSFFLIPCFTEFHTI